MKRVICLALVAILLFVGICILTRREQSSLLNDYWTNLDAYNSPTRDFGTPASFIRLDANLSVGILYPETEYPFLNDAITQWIRNTVKECADDCTDANSAELSVSYECHRVTDEIISIQLQGNFFSNAMAHPVEILQTFHANVKDGVLIGVPDILDPQYKRAFVSMVASKTQVEPETVDAQFLDNGLLTKDGIQVTLARGKYLPMSDGTKKCFFPYKEIREYLQDDFLPKAVPEATEEPVMVTDPTVPKIEAPQPQIDPDKPMLALTFDDGPSAHTDRLLDIFAEYGGHGTFFVLGDLIDNRQSTLVRIASEGHEIGNHSWSHRQLTNLSDREITDQIMRTRAKIYEITGRDCLIMRPPYGAINDQVKAVGKEVGVSFVNWSVDTLDWKTRNAEAVCKEILSNASDGAIILCHDLHRSTVDAMETVIPKLLEEGYQLVTVTQLMEAAGNTMKPGKLYFRQ